VPEDSDSEFKSPVLDLQGGLWVFRESSKILIASDQFFLSYVKNTRGGQIAPPPGGIGLKLKKADKDKSSYKEN